MAFTPKNIVKGDDLMLFDAQGHSIAYATAHTLTLTADASDISTKDHGIYKGYEVNKIDWEITSENLYTEEEYASLFDLMMKRKPIDIYFAMKSEKDPEKTVYNGDYPYWTAVTGVTERANEGYYGKAFITSLVSNANTGENATLSITLKGTGKITNQATIPVANTVAGETE